MDFDANDAQVSTIAAFSLQLERVFNDIRVAAANGEIMLCIPRSNSAFEKVLKKRLSDLGYEVLMQSRIEISWL